MTCISGGIQLNFENASTSEWGESKICSLFLDQAFLNPLIP